MKGMTMRQFALALLILIAAPTIAWGDAYDDLKDEMECLNLMRRGNACVEYVWTDGGEVKKGERCARTQLPNKTVTLAAPTIEDFGMEITVSVPQLPEVAANCRCNRKAYQDFGIGERIKYHWCK